MLGHLVTEKRNPASVRIDALTTLEMLRVINEEDHKVAEAVKAELPRIAAAVDAIVETMDRGGRLFYIGAGTSGRLGVLDASECPPTFDVPPDLVQGVIAGGEPALARSVEASEDDAEGGARDLLGRGFTSADIVAGISASGRTPYVLGAVRAARALGAKTIGISCTPDSQLSREVDYPIEPVPGPEIIAGSTRLKAGTATKMVLNMLSTGAMIRRGLVFGNLMVNLQPRNEKLRDRARRIVCEATGLDPEAGARLYREAGENVKTAIVMAKLGLSREEAEKRLAAHGGRVAAAIGG
jgi:N-acetylmuramic acid 6-phosphate etherase